MTIRLLGRRSGLVLGAGPRHFLPSDVTGLKLWLKADAGVFQDAARTTPAVADADPAGSVSDYSGFARHLSQSTTTKRGTLKQVTNNGKTFWVIRGDGSDDSLEVASDLGLSGSDLPFTIIWAASITFDAINRAAWALSDADGTTRQFILPRTDVGYIDERRDDANVSANHTLGTVTAGPTWKVYSYVFEGTTSSLWVNGTNVFSAQALDVGVCTFTRFVMLNSGTGLNASNGDIFPPLVYNRALSDSERQQLERSWVGPSTGVTVA